MSTTSGFATCPQCGCAYPNGATDPIHRCNGLTLSFSQPLRVGWRCPSCRNVWSPDVKQCKTCKRLQVAL